MSAEILESHRDIWKKKPVLRKLYTEWYQEIASHLLPGLTLELGGGSGNLKEFAPDVICTDIVEVPWLDAVADAQAIPFSNGSFSNIVLFDVLHHIENPALFFEEALRVLAPGGRIVIMDPYISPASWPVYHFLHPEPVDLRADPLLVQPPDKDRQPFDSNQAVARLLFEKRLAEFVQKFPRLKIRLKRYFSFFVYPLSGGFDHPSLVPSFLVSPLLRLEKLLRPLGRLLAFRVLVVIEAAPHAREQAR